MTDFLGNHLPDGTGRNFRLVLRNFIRTAFALTLFPPGTERTGPEGYDGELAVTALDGRWVGGIRAIDRPITERVTFDEEIVRQACRIEGDDASLLKSIPLDFMETVIAITKMLHKARLPLEGRRWIVCRIDLKKFPAPQRADPLQIGLAQQLNVSLTRSRVRLAGQDVGDLYFSAVMA